MERRDTPSRLLSLLPSGWRKPSADGTATAPARTRTGSKPGARAGAARSEEFRARSYPHLDAIYTDAFCLTGSREEAVDLVVAAYLRAYRGYDRFRRRWVPERRRTAITRIWLYGCLHAAFCDRILAQTTRRETPIGGRPW